VIWIQGALFPYGQIVRAAKPLLERASLLTKKLCIVKLSATDFATQSRPRSFNSMHHPSSYSRLRSILIGTTLGVVFGVAVAFVFTILIFQGVGAAQGVTDSPGLLPFVFVFFGFFGVLVDGLVGGLAGFMVSASSTISGVEKPVHIDDLS
jgi:hypothetical protein